MRVLSSEDVPRLQRTVFNMTDHSPDEDQAERIEQIRELGKQFAAAVYVNCPYSRERSVAITQLEDCLMWAVASIAREGDE